jgi:hypothetical protein
MRALAHTVELVALSFESAVVPGLPLAALQRLARSTLAVNPRLGLTGELRLEAGRFALELEGRADVLLPLAARILADPRHTSIRIADFGGIDDRRFAGWSTAGFGIAADDGAAHFPTMPAPPLRDAMQAIRV